ncbi:MAG: methylated-DNA--[protein]-cysteine S-methyltransferase [Streptosporangiaceae bacterium]
MESLAWTVADTPIGPLMLAATTRGLVKVHFHAGRPEPVVAAVAARLELEPVRQARVDPAQEQLEAYFRGGLTVFDLPLDWSLSGGFHQAVLALLYARVPFGSVVGYGDLARWVGEPGAARAVGVAMGANPLPVVVPCHRVVNSSGELGGFGGGLETKRVLLALEGVLPEPLF